MLGALWESWVCPGRGEAEGSPAPLVVRLLGRLVHKTGFSSGQNQIPGDSGRAGRQEGETH